MTRKGDFLRSEEHLASRHVSLAGGKMAASGGVSANDDYGFDAQKMQAHLHQYPLKQQQDTLPLPPPNLGDLGGPPPMPEAIYAAPGDNQERDTMGKIPRKFICDPMQ
jgi:hypothetical protein